jgi:hypothetical protein
MAEPEALVDGRDEEGPNALYIRSKRAVGDRKNEPKRDAAARCRPAGSALSRQEEEVARGGKD